VTSFFLPSVIPFSRCVATLQIQGGSESAKSNTLNYCICKPLNTGKLQLHLKVFSATQV